MTTSEIQVTADLLAALEWRYAVEPFCRVCGARLELVDTRGMKMACTSDAASPFRSRHEAAGVTWKEAMAHYEESTRYNPPPGDPQVVALVQEIRRLRERAQ